MLKPNINKVRKNTEEVFGSYWRGLSSDEKLTVLNNIEAIMFYGDIKDSPENIQLIANAMRNCFFIGMRY